MFRTKFIMMLAGCLILRDNPEGGGGGGAEETPALPETIVSDIPKPENITDEEWLGMTDAERESLNITAEQLADEEGAELGEADLDAVLEDDAPAEGEATAGDEATAETATPGEILSDDALLAFRPVVAANEIAIPEVAVPAEIQTEIDALEAKLDDLDKKFDDGDIDNAAYRSEQRQINKEITAVNRKASEAVFELKATARDNARADVEMNKTEQAFHAARPEYSEKDEKGEYTLKSESLYGALEKTVAKLSAQYPHKSFMERLLLADKTVRETFGMPARTAVKVAAKPAERIAATKPTVKTLANVPVAADNEANPYANIMKLQGEEFAKALEDMTPKQLEAFSKWQAR